MEKSRNKENRHKNISKEKEEEISNHETMKGVETNTQEKTPQRKMKHGR